MNFKNIIQEQVKLDKAMNEAHQTNKNDEWFHKAILALYVEVGELANEIQSFKYWKKNKNINQQAIEEEYADGIHFLMSFAIDLNIEHEINATVVSKNINKQFLYLFSTINNFYKRKNKKNIKKAISAYLGIAQLIDLNDDEIEKGYMKKNKINFERIKNNY